MRAIILKQCDEECPYFIAPGNDILEWKCLLSKRSLFPPSNSFIESIQFEEDGFPVWCELKEHAQKKGRKIDLQMEKNNCKITATWDDYKGIVTSPKGFGDNICCAVTNLIEKSSAVEINGIVSSLENDV